MDTRKKTYKGIISLWPRKSPNSEGHAALDVVDENGKPVTYINQEGKEVPVRLSFYPSGRAYKSNSIIFGFLNMLGFNFKSNHVHNLLRAPVDGFSTNSPESDARIEQRHPKKFFEVDLPENIIDQIQETHGKIKDNEIEFHLDYNSSAAPLFRSTARYVRHCFDKSNIENDTHYQRAGISMPIDLIEQGGDFHNDHVFEHQPRQQPILTNCAGLIEDTLHKQGILPEPTCGSTTYPYTLFATMNNSGNFKPIELNQTPPHLQSIFSSARQQYKKTQAEKSDFEVIADKLSTGCEPQRYNDNNWKKFE